MLEAVNISLAEAKLKFQSTLLPPIAGNVSKYPTRVKSETDTFRILVVDDSLVCLKIFSKFISDLGHNVVVCSNALGALALIRSTDQPFDCLLIDVNMPSMTAIEATRILRQNETDMKIIIMSASSEYHDEAIACGPHAFILKPFQKTELKKILSTVLVDKTQFSSRPDASESISPRVRSSGEKMRAIIVDDSAVCLKMLGKSFSELGYEVDLFFDGEQAFKHLQQCDAFSISYDLIVTDISMPLLNGLEFITLCRTALNIKAPIYALSAHGQNMIKALGCGADGFLEKPVSPKALSETFATFASVREYSDRMTFEVEDDVLAVRMRVPLLSRGTARKLREDPNDRFKTMPKAPSAPRSSISRSISRERLSPQTTRALGSTDAR